VSAARCPAVHIGDPTIPFAVAVPVRCSKQVGHPSEFHAAAGRDLDGEVFGVAWRYLLALTS
jgi:hypothetical protein